MAGRPLASVKSKGAGQGFGERRRDASWLDANAERGQPAHRSREEAITGQEMEWSGCGIGRPGGHSRPGCRPRQDADGAQPLRRRGGVRSFLRKLDTLIEIEHRSVDIEMTYYERTRCPELL